RNRRGGAGRPRPGQPPRRVPAARARGAGRALRRPSGEHARARPQHADLPFRPAAPCRPRQRAPRRPLDDLRRALRGHARAYRLSHRELLRGCGSLRSRRVRPRAVDGTQHQGDRLMKRFHVHVGVENLPQAIGFYSTLFATQPSVVKPDYAKWMLDDPRINFAISTRGKQPGLDHLGIQVESKDELHAVYGRLHDAGGTVTEQGEVTCCYAKGEKAWIDDPSGIAW